VGLFANTKIGVLITKQVNIREQVLNEEVICDSD
jgi:hypothetical protein